MPAKDIIVIGTSTGGIEATKVLVAALPRDLEASLFIVLHIGANGLGILPEILERAGCLPASNAKNGEVFEPGHIYVAPPDHHLLVEQPRQLRVTRGPKENRFRPAVDPLFRSAAYAFGARVIGVILTGGLDDGTAGLWSIKARGGTAVVQDPCQALAPSMPLSAMRHVAVDRIMPLEEIAPFLVKLSRVPVEQKRAIPMPKQLKTEVDIAKEAYALNSGILDWGEPSYYACPECHGVLLQLKEETNLRFRCHTGHAYSIESLLAEFNERIEENLWSAMRSLEETVLLMRHLAAHFSESDRDAAAEQLLHKAKEAERRIESIRQTVMAQEIATRNEPI